MTQAEERLRSRGWRFVQSLWMIAGWTPFAMTAWIGYLIIGIRGRSWKWLAIAGAFLAWTIVMFAWAGSLPVVPSGQSSTMSASTSLFAVSVLLVWLGNVFGLQLWINRKWLVRRAHLEKGAPWYARTPDRIQGGAFYPHSVDSVPGAQPPVGGIGNPSELASFRSLEPPTVAERQLHGGGVRRNVTCDLCGATGSGANCEQCGAALAWS